MNIPFHHSLKDADRVLKRLRSLAKSHKMPRGVDFYVESLVNCREQGYAIFGSNYIKDLGIRGEFYASFGQHRCSDSVFVNLGMAQSFDVKLCDIWTGNIASEEVWKNQQTFEWQKDGSHYTKAAEFILSQMKLFAGNPKLSKFYIEPTKKEKAA